MTAGRACARKDSNLASLKTSATVSDSPVADADSPADLSAADAESAGDSAKAEKRRVRRERAARREKNAAVPPHDPGGGEIDPAPVSHAQNEKQRDRQKRSAERRAARERRRAKGEAGDSDISLPPEGAPLEPSTDEAEERGDDSLEIESVEMSSAKSRLDACSARAT